MEPAGSPPTPACPKTLPPFRSTPPISIPGPSSVRSIEEASKVLRAQDFSTPPTSFNEWHRLALFKLGPREEIQLLESLRKVSNDPASIDRFFLKTIPFLYRPQWEDPHLFFPYLFRKVVAAGPEHLESNLNALLTLIQHYDIEIEGFYLLYVYLEISRQLYQLNERALIKANPSIKANPPIISAIRKLLEDLKKQFPHPRYNLEFPLMGTLSENDVSIYEDFLETLLSIAPFKTPFDPDLNKKALSCLKEMNYDKSKETALIPFLMSFMAPSHIEILEANDRSIINKACLSHISALKIGFDWCRLGRLGLSPKEWLAELLENNSNRWLNVFIIVIFICHLKHEITEEELLKHLDHLYTTPSREDLNHFFVGLEYVDSHFQHFKKFREWLSIHIGGFLITYATTPKKKGGLEPTLLTLLREANGVDPEMSKAFNQILNSWGNPMIAIEEPEDFFEKVRLLFSKKTRPLFAQVNGITYDKLSKRMTPQISDAIVGRYLKLLTLIRSIYGVNFNPDAIHFVLKDRVDLDRIVKEDTTIWKDLGLKPNLP